MTLGGAKKQLAGPIELGIVPADLFQFVKGNAGGKGRAVRGRNLFQGLQRKYPFAGEMEVTITVLFSPL